MDCQACNGTGDGRKFGDLVQAATDHAVSEVDKILAVKEQEIMQV